MDPPSVDSREWTPGTGELPAPDAFALLGDGLRASILRVLFRTDSPVAFSTVRDRVDVEDPGLVNYHLDRLCPHFVARTEEGYRLQRPGRRAVRILLAGTVTGSTTLPTVDLGACVCCGGALSLRYSDGFATVVCGDCERWFVRRLLAPGGIDAREPPAVPDLLDARCRSDRLLGNAGVCPLCSGTMARRVVDDGPFDHPASVEYRCRRCGCRFDSTLGATLVGHPAVVEFCRERGVDPGGRYLWDLAFAFDPDAVRSDEEGATLVIAANGDRLQVAVDGSVGVTGEEVQDR